jgi:hypothetical protein
MIKLSEKVLRDEAAMRTVYQALGVSFATTEAAIKLRRKKPATLKAPSPQNGKRRVSSSA